MESEPVVIGPGDGSSVRLGAIGARFILDGALTGGGFSLVEIISPAGFEGYFAEIGEILAGGGPPDPQRMAALRAKYELEMDMASVPGLCEEFGVEFPMPSGDY